jgi:hypothetical protein
VADPHEIVPNPAQGRNPVLGQTIIHCVMIVAKAVVFKKAPVGSKPDYPGGILQDAFYLVVLPAAKEFMKSLVGPLASSVHCQSQKKQKDGNPVHKPVSLRLAFQM